VSIRDYEAELASNGAKGSLVKAATGASVSEIPQPQLVFRADTEAALRQQLSEGQKPLAVLDYQLREMHSALEAGLKDRPKVKEPRWRAGFDLAMGRVLAMRVRAFGYNAMLAEMKLSPKSFQREGSNMWQLVPTGAAPDIPAVKKMAEEAKEYLTRVVQEHPGTPWAQLAQAEMDAPQGWTWEEGHMFIPRPPTAEEVRRQLLLAEEQRRRQPMPQPPPMQRVAPKL
jgi:hypothetical protein